LNRSFHPPARSTRPLVASVPLLTNDRFVFADQQLHRRSPAGVVDHRCLEAQERAQLFRKFRRLRQAGTFDEQRENGFALPDHVRNLLADDIVGFVKAGGGVTVATRQLNPLKWTRFPAQPAR
jgi:hypothetical protein